MDYKILKKFHTIISLIGDDSKNTPKRKRSKTFQKLFFAIRSVPRGICQRACNFKQRKLCKLNNIRLLISEEEISSIYNETSLTSRGYV